MITVYGEGLIDLVPQHPSPLAPLTPALGGGPFNVAIVAARQTGGVRFQSRLSSDPFGQQLVDKLVEEGVDVSGVQRGEEPTTLAVTTVAKDGSAAYAFYNEGTADRFIEPTAEDCDIACFGTCSLAWEPGATRLGKVLKELSQAGRLVALDPNIRPAFATDEHRQRLLGLIAHTHLLKLSDEEVEFFGGIEALISAGPEAIVVTHGEKGIEFYCGSLHLQVPGIEVEIKDTIGAGDTVLGTIVAALDQLNLKAGQLESLGADAWRKILHRAAVAAAITCSRSGAVPPTKPELDAALAELS